MLGAARSVSRAAAMVAGLASALALFFSPAGDWATRMAILPTPASSSARSLYYAASVEPLRDTRGYARARATAPAGHSDLLVLGSSEISAPVSQNPSRFFPEKVSDFDLFLDGRGYTQSLYHAIGLAAKAESLPTPRKVALIVSPQWFSAEGASSKAFQDVFSAPQFQGMVGNPRLTPATRTALLERSSMLLRDPVWVRSASGGRAELAAALSAPAVPLQRRAAVLKQTSEAVRATSGMSAPFRVAGAAVPIDQMDWRAQRAAAAQQGEAAVTNNAYGVEDSYFDKYIRKDLASLSGALSDLDYSGPSPEWGDLDLLLTVAHELDVEVLMVSVPMNGRWYDYAGYPAERRARYYDRVRATAARHSAPLADFSDREYEEYFLIDIMHLGWKGWLDVAEASVRFARS